MQQNEAPRAPPVKYKAPLGTRWEKEKAAAGSGAFDYPDDAKYVGPWVIGECVGRGASGHVKIARHRRTGQLAAVKILPLQPFVDSRASQAAQAKSDKQRLGIDREITMMKLMNHPNIMRIYDVYEGEKQLYLVLEYIEGGELFDFLVNRGKLPPLEALAYFKQIVYGLNYAHTFSIIHRDLKPENILIHSLNPPLVKIADWGMAAFAPPSLQLETSCGSPHYASPEIVNGHKYRGTATDIWSCGVILYALLTGRLPFDDKNVRTLLGKVKLGKYDMPAFIDPLAKDLLSRMLVVDVTRRVTMSEVLSHPWLEGLTPGILYVPAPPVSELAKPLPSYLHIDRDLFESLCVIWGRHADPEVIKTDLLSPAGQGTLAKAFYFLLQKHREKTMEEHGILMDIDDLLHNAGKVVMKQYASPRTKPSQFVGQPPQLNVQPVTRAQLQQQQQRLRANRTAPAPPPRTPSPGAMVIDVPLMERVPSRPHPVSPVGPRPHKPRPTSSPAPPATQSKHSFMAPPSSFRPPHDDAVRPKSVVRMQSLPSPDAFAAPRVRANAHSMFVTPASHVLPMMQRSQPTSARGVVRAPIAGPSGTTDHNWSASAPGVIHTPVPVPAVSTAILPMITAPRAPTADMQRTLEQYATMVNIQAASWNAAASQDLSSENARQSLAMNIDAISPRTAHSNSENKNKENCERSAASRRPSQSQTGGQVTGGLGFGQSVPMGREMGNMVYLRESTSKVQKESKHRPPALDLNLVSPVLQKRSTFSLLGSPTATSPLVTSPVVGEFKGWFSNLFHWKVQSYLLYSTDNVVATRTEAARLLEQFGVVVALEENQNWSVLKCRVDDIYDAAPGGAISSAQKQVRFRVEFSAGPGTQTYSQPGATPRLSQGAMSPITSSTRGRMDKLPISGYETILGVVLEKGSVSTFKVIYQRLRNEWRMDALQSPQTAASEASGMEQRFMA